MINIKYCSISGGANDWPYLLSVYVLLVIVCLPVLFILPESPKYLFVIKRNEAAAIKGEINEKKKQHVLLNVFIFNTL